MEPQNTSFRYSYSAKEQAEIRYIREKYAPPAEENTLECLRRLDARVTQKAQMYALIVGILGAMLLGFGMSLIMTDLAAKIGLPYAFAFGILAGVIGLVGVALAYPVYNRVIQKERARIAPKILLLTEELMK